MGSLAGSALFPTQLPSGPRITDNRTTTATIGEPVPILFGTADLAGTVLWLAPMIEHKSEQGGKGGPEQTVFNYTQSIAIGLCERVDDTAPDDVGAISGLTRVWENGTIVYDIRPQQEANTQLGTLAETDEQYANRLTVSAAYAETFTLYLGDEVQDADPTIEAIEGMGNVPGFRGLAYIVYPDRALQNAQGLRHPNFTFECFQAGTGDCSDETELSNDLLLPWDMTSSDPRDTNTEILGGYAYQFQRTDGGTATPSRTTLEAAMDDAVEGGGSNTPFTLQSHIYGWNLQGSNVGGGLEPWDTVRHFTFSGQPGPPIASDGTQSPTLYVWLNRDVSVGPLDFGIPETGVTSFCAYATSQPTGRWWIGEATVSGAGESLRKGMYNYPFATDAGSFNCSGFSIIVVMDDAIKITQSPTPPPDPCAGLLPAPIIPFCIRADGRWIKGGAWTLDTSQQYKVLYSGVAVSATGYLAYQNPCLKNGDPNYSDSTFWTTAYNAAVAAHKLPAGWTFGVQYPQTQNRAWTIDLQICSGSGAEASVADIISAICKRAGLTADQIDVSDLTAIFVPGYSISGICDAADIISPLRSMAFFDCVESGNVLRFPTRGKEIVKTLTEDQIGCYDSGTTGGDGGAQTNIPPSVAITRQDETTLPRSIRLHYKAVSRDYQDGEQDSPFRLTTRAVDDQDISIPLCIGDVQAAQAADILWSDAWAAQKSYIISVDQSLSELEGGDCIGVPVDGVIQRMRIVTDSNAAFVLRKLTCVADDEGSYISFAVATPPAQPPSILVFMSPTLAVFLNIPSLSDADDNAGFYVVAYPDPSVGNRWLGATFYQSIDGTNFSQVGATTQAATVGTLESAVPESEAFTWDTTTIITVNLPASESFESRTDDAVLAGANAAAMGADGRWEIVQFATATQITPTQWQLSRLLRGRRGTEYVIGSSVTGDQFVMVSTGDLVRIPLSVSQIGAPYVYSVVTAGAAFGTGNIYDFTSRGTALKPFAPVRLSATRETGDDIVFSWVRRNRLGRALMSGVILPMSEATLAFQVDIIDPTSPASPEVVLRTLSVTSESARYTAAEQHADFGSPVPSSVKVAIYQMSAIVGRGFPAIELLTVE